MKEYEIIEINYLLSTPIKVLAKSPKEAAEKALKCKVKRNDKGGIVVYGKYASGRYGYIVKSFVYEACEPTKPRFRKLPEIANGSYTGGMGKYYRG